MCNNSKSVFCILTLLYTFVSPHLLSQSCNTSLAYQATSARSNQQIPSKRYEASGARLQSDMSIDKQNASPTGVAVLEEAPRRSVSDGRICDTYWLDGYPMVVDANTIIYEEMSPLRIHYRSPLFRPFRVYPTIHKQDERLQRNPATIPLGSWVYYITTRSGSGILFATELHVWSKPDSKELAFAKAFKPILVTQQESSGMGELVEVDKGLIVAHVLPDQELQKWLSVVVNSLIPAYQSQLSTDDPRKIHFRVAITDSITAVPAGYFFDVNGIERGFDKWDHPTYVRGGLVDPKGDHLLSILISPDGLILIPDVLLARIHTQAQAAALLSFAIAAVIQKQGYQSWPILFSKHPQVSGDGFLIAFGEMQSEQQYRVGIRQMYLAGYDIREADGVWEVAQAARATTRPIHVEKPAKLIPSYASQYISHYYKYVDYSKLKRGEAEYQQFLDELRKADPEAFTDPDPSSKP